MAHGMIHDIAVLHVGDPLVGVVASGGPVASAEIRPWHEALAIDRGFKLCTSRLPTAKESALLLNLLSQQRASAVPDSIPPMVTIARVLLNLDETITKE